MCGQEHDLEDYYGCVAEEYDRLYQRDDSVRQDEISTIAEELGEALRDRCVLEVACGTGFWTEIVAEVAQHVVATDKLSEMLSIARKRCGGFANVDLLLADAYMLESVPGAFDAGFAGFWFSHIPKARVDGFLDGFHRRLGPGALVFMVDSVYIPGLGGELVSLPGREDTFRRRRVSDGSTHLVLKNYYDSVQLHSILGGRSEGLRMDFGSCYWRVQYVVH